MIAPLPNVNLADNETTEQPRRSIWGRQIIGSREACSLSMSLVQHTHTHTHSQRSQTNTAARTFYFFYSHPRIQLWNDPWRGYQRRALLAVMTMTPFTVFASWSKQTVDTHICAGGACALGLPRADWRVVGSEVSAQGAAKPAGGADTLGTMFSSTPPSFALSHSLPLSHSPSFNVLLVVSVHDGLCLCSKNKNWALKKRHGETKSTENWILSIF